MTTQLSIPENALSIQETHSFTALTFTTRTTLNTLSQHVRTVAEDLYAEANRLNLDVSGPIYWVYTGASGDENQEFQLEIALPIAQQRELSSEFSYKTFPSFRCASYTYAGPWSDFKEVYSILFSQLYREGYQGTGNVREVYTVIDFENQENCITDIQIGIA
jgi:effector-binding domain-containing protein